MASVDKISKAGRFREHFEYFLEQTQLERDRSRLRRDYRDLRQWTEEEVEHLKSREQAPIVFDQFGKKVDAFCGLEINRRSQPKALPRTPKHEDSADAMTEALRYTDDQTEFEEIATEVFEEKLVEGYGAVIVEYDADKKKVTLKQIPWDRFFYDPHSRMKNFHDAGWMGVTIWMDRRKAERIWGDVVAKLMDTTGTDGLDFEDRPRNWVDRDLNRVRVNEEYFIDNGQWHRVVYSGDTILEEPKLSDYVDEDGNHINPIEAQSDYVTRDNTRYGYTARLVDPQDEINHRRSKALYMLSAVSLILEKGALGEMSRIDALNELRKAQSVLEVVNPAGVQLDRNIEMGQSQLAFYQDALQAMDSVGINPELLRGETDQAISGRAFIARQQAGMTETAKIFSQHSAWKKRVYTQMWYRIRQFWDEEKWLSVTDDQKVVRWVGLNYPVTRAEQLAEQQSGQDINDLRKVPGFEQALQQTLAQDPAMTEVVEVRNNPAELEMDIIIEDVPDTLTLQQEQFDILANLASAGAPPQIFKALLQLSTMPKKDEILRMLEGDIQQQIQQQQELEAVNKAQIQADIQNLQSDTAKNVADIQLKEAQTIDERASAVERIDRASRLD